MRKYTKKAKKESKRESRKDQEKKHICSSCGKKFGSPAELKRHVLSGNSHLMLDCLFVCFSGPFHMKESGYPIKDLASRPGVGIGNPLPGDK